MATACSGRSAKRLVNGLRDTDTVGRLGGDEFAILPGDSTDLVAAAAVAWKIEQMCEPGFVINQEVVHVTTERRHRPVP